MKRWIAVLLAMIMTFGAAGLAALAENAGTGDEPAAAEAEEQAWVEYDYDELRVGNPTPMDGKFFTECWGNATSDIDVRTLVHGYRLVSWSADFGMFRENPTVVNGIAVIDDDEEGDRNYILHLCEDLFYSDGTPITAWDYAFSVLFQGAPVLAELGALPANMEYLKGYDEYARGEVPYISGLRVMNTYMLQITVKKEYLPYFFEFYRLAIMPYPIHEIAPGCKVYDDGEGCYIDNENRSLPEKLFGKELLEVTVMDPDNGYLSHPTVGAGPYRLTGWDGQTCTFEINPFFKGDEEGNLPTIPRLKYTLAENDTMIDKLMNGEFGLLNKVTRADTIVQGMQETNARNQYTFINYPRIGQTFIVFTPDRPALQQKNVRQAINYCLEKEEVVNEYTAGFGLPMDGLMGLGQWMYQLIMGTLPYPYPIEQLPANPTAAQQAAYDEEVSRWQALNLNGLKHYEKNVEEAVRLLEEAGWTLNEQGEPFVPGTDEVRCREIDGELVKLDLTCAYPETNITAESFEEFFIPNLAEAGIKLTLIPMDMKTLLRSYNDRDIEEIDMFYIGDDFNIEFDPRLFFLPGDENMTEEDTLAWTHHKMYELCDDMVTTEPYDVYGFMTKWIRMQEELSEELPLIPVYSNIYFDFYTRELQQYEDILPKVTWGEAIVGSTFSEPPVIEAAATEEPADNTVEIDD